MLVKTFTIKRSPLSHLAGVWDHLIEDMAMVEARLGWRYLWEGDTFAQRCGNAQARAIAEYKLVIDWRPADETEAQARRELLSISAPMSAPFRTSPPPSPLTRASATTSPIPASPPCAPERTIR